MKYFTPLVFIYLFTSCLKQPERDCKKHQTGTYNFSSVVNGDTLHTKFTRNKNFEIDYFNGNIDTSSVRWINDCECILKNTNPKNRSEEKAVHIKILTTTDSSYTFEFSAVDETNKLKGTAIKN